MGSQSVFCSLICIFLKCISSSCEEENNQGGQPLRGKICICSLDVFTKNSRHLTIICRHQRFNRSLSPKSSLFFLLSWTRGSAKGQTNRIHQTEKILSLIKSHSKMTYRYDDGVLTSWILEPAKLQATRFLP